MPHTPTHDPRSKAPSDVAPTFVVMAKTPVPGQVKTRLTQPGPDHDDAPLSPRAAADVHAALLTCLLERLAPFVKTGQARGLVAFDQPDLIHSPPTDTSDLHANCTSLHTALPQAGFALTDQGTGDLGSRLEHVWNRIASAHPQTPDAPVVFLGVDSPDLPVPHLKAALHHAQAAPADAAIGPVADGGYWCLAAARPRAALLRGIDWGTPAVYDQTHRAARDAGLTLADLDPWHDVDDPHDLQRLRQRLTDSAPQDPALQRLADTLDRIIGDRA